jgi:hypothetical protein
MKTKTIVSIAAILFCSTLSFAHHGGSMYPDREDVVILEGAIIDELLFVNPHARLLFNWTDANGTLTAWEGELSGSTELVRSGVYGNLVEPGDRVTIKGWSHDSIPRNLRINSIVLPDGQEVALP